MDRLSSRPADVSPIAAKTWTAGSRIEFGNRPARGGRHERPAPSPKPIVAVLANVFQAGSLGVWQPVPPEGRSLEQLTGDIKDGHHQVHSALRYGAVAAIASGKSLPVNRHRPRATFEHIFRTRKHEPDPMPALLCESYEFRSFGFS